MARWMLYGATGYTGQLLAEEAVRRGHQPVLAGRTAAKLAPLAERLGLAFVAVDLHDEAALNRATADVELVFHAAGPFVFTGEPMIQACLATHTHYLDIAGEIPNLLSTFRHVRAAHQAGITLISGVGFDVVPTDCLAKYLADQEPGAVVLELAVDALSTPSAGTVKSLLEMAPGTSWVRENGQLLTVPFSTKVREVRFSHSERSVIPVPWGDLVTAYHTTGIPTIRTYLAIAKPLRYLAGLAIPVAQHLLANATIRRWMSGLVGRVLKGPDASTRSQHQSYIWACASDASGKTTQAWLETSEAYQFTAIAGIRAVEKVLAAPPQGVLTPALAFGADLVLEIEGTRRFDRLPET
jgi:short subunit dehydrogenase-like uncharacterized protein